FVLLAGLGLRGLGLRRLFLYDLLRPLHRGLRRGAGFLAGWPLVACRAPTFSARLAGTTALLPRARHRLLRALRLGRRLRLSRGRRRAGGCAGGGLAVGLRRHFTLVDPALDADHAVGGLGFAEAVIDVGAQRMQRHAALAVPLGARDLDAVQAAGAHDLDALRAKAHGVLHGALHRPAEHDALLELLRDRVGDQLRVDLGLPDLLDVHVHLLHAHDAAQLRLERLDLLAFLADHHARAGGEDGDARVLRRALDQHAADRGVRQLPLQELAHLDVFREHRCEVLAVGVPARAPVLVHRQAKAHRMDLLAHQSPTVIKMWHVCLSTRLPRPLARAWKRFRNMPRSTNTRFTFSVSMSAPSLCSALATADSSTFFMMSAPFFGV